MRGLVAPIYPSRSEALSHCSDEFRSRREPTVGIYNFFKFYVPPRKDQLERGNHKGRLSLCSWKAELQWILFYVVVVVVVVRYFTFSSAFDYLFFVHINDANVAAMWLFKLCNILKFSFFQSCIKNWQPHSLMHTCLCMCTLTLLTFRKIFLFWKH